MSFKVAIIGAGSVGFTKTLISDLLKVPEFADVEFALTDINPHNLDMIQQIISLDRRGQQAARQGHRHHRSPRRDHRRALHHELRPRRRARGLRHRHLHPAQIRRRPVRGRHHLRRRHPLRPAQHPGDPRFLQGYPRGRRARRAVPQLCQPDGDEHLGGARIWRRQHRRPLPRRPARRPPDRRRCSASRTANSTTSARASTTRPGTSISAPRAGRSRRTS